MVHFTWEASLRLNLNNKDISPEIILQINRYEWFFKSTVNQQIKGIFILMKSGIGNSFWLLIYKNPSNNSFYQNYLLFLDFKFYLFTKIAPK